jgi:hypothetical protein
MDMSDKLVAEEADDLEQAREALRTGRGVRHRPPGSAISAALDRPQAQADVRRCGRGGDLLGSFALSALVDGNGCGRWPAADDVGDRGGVAAIGALSIRFVQTDLVRPLEQLRRHARAGRRQPRCRRPARDRADEIGAMAATWW